MANVPELVDADAELIIFSFLVVSIPFSPFHVFLHTPCNSRIFPWLTIASQPRGHVHPSGQILASIKISEAPEATSRHREHYWEIYIF